MAEAKKGQGPTDAGQSSDAVFEDIFEHIDVDNIDTAATPAKKSAAKKKVAPKKAPAKKTTKKKAVAKKAPAKKAVKKVPEKKKSLDIDDISAYIASTKAQQEEKEAVLTTKDGVDLRTLPNIYAVVPHVKGDHKLVYFHTQAPEGLKDDPKGRVAGSSYMKK